MRRRNREQTITLFSFQDIITGVAGVMLFVLLLLVVQLSLRSAVALENQPPPEPTESTPVTNPTAGHSFPELQRDLESMRRELEEIQQHNEALLQAASRDLKSEIRSAQAEIDDLIRAGDETKTRAKQLASDIASQEVSPERQRILDRRQRLKQELQRLGAEQQRHASGKLVAFKTAENQNTPMWVVDLHDRRASLFDVQSPSEVAEVAYRRELPPSVIAALIKKQLQTRTKTRNIILLLRPSVAGRGVDYMQSFRGAGYRVALELLDEDTLVTQSSSRPPEKAGAL